MQEHHAQSEQQKPNTGVRVLVPVDFSGASELSVRYAKNFVRSFGGGEIYLAHVIEMPEDSRQWSLLYTQFEELGSKFHKEVHAKLQVIAEQLEEDGIIGHVVVMSGIPYTQLAKYIIQHGVTLVVIATHSEHELGHIILGSTTQRLLQTVSCPVLVIKEQYAASLE